MATTRKFDTKVQYLKYKVFREVARRAFDGTLMETILDIPKAIMPGPKPTMRCCVFKERAIVAERIKIAMGGDRTNPNIIEVIDIACDECPVGGHLITDSCRGCIAHYCQDACPRDCIVTDEHQRAHIVKEKCIECGRCAQVCPYHAIHNVKRPCEDACKVKAIDMNENMAARIDGDKCVACGACVYQCPWGAIMDKSYILNAVHFLRERAQGEGGPLVAVVAPSIAGQFAYAKLGQVLSGIRALGFDAIEEVALGADMAAYDEAEELYETGMLTSSCCPAFVDYVQKAFPQLAGYVSKGLSPMGRIGKRVKERLPDARVVFIGPCTAKKTEAQREDVHKYIDCVLTFEELQALFDARDIDITKLEPGALNTASRFGRVFARSGGVAEAVAEGLKERGHTDFDYKPLACDGLEQCRAALLRLGKGVLPHNFLEGMACEGGCINGAGCLTHGAKSRAAADAYGKEAEAETIREAVERA